MLCVMQVGVSYDPMIAKVIAWGPDRITALSRLHTALMYCCVCTNEAD